MAAAERGIPERVSRARAALARTLASADGLVGVGIGARPGGEFEILVLVREPGCEAALRAPRTHLGCPVRVEISGPPRRQRG